MMGQQPPLQEKLFYTGLTLDKRIRRNHPLRNIDEVIDFEFIYNEVKDKYGSNGNVSVPPPIILKLMLLLVFYNVRSERELMDTGRGMTEGSCGQVLFLAEPLAASKRRAI